MSLFKGIFQIFLGIGIVIFSISLGIAWLGFCFGTVIIGIALLLIAPHVLLFPFGFTMLGTMYIASGACIGFGIGCSDD